MTQRKGRASSMTSNDNSSAHSSSEYDQAVIKTIPFYRQFHLETIDLIRTLQPDVSLWLDTGCGTGALPEQAVPLFPRTRFLLADPSQSMLDQAKARLAGFPQERIVYVGAVGSEDLSEVVSERPQVISAIQCHHYGDRESRRRATHACHQVLASHGVYVTFENIRPATPEGVEYGLERWLRFQAVAGRSADVVAEHRRRFDHDYFPITVAEHLELLRDTGFRTVELFWLSQMQAGFYAIKG